MFSLDENQKPIDDGTVVPEPVVMPSNDSPTSVPSPMPPTAPATPPLTVAETANHESTDSLEDIRKEALGELAPLVGKLDLNPEDKFRTTMMMIQATDNKDLIKDAHEAAKTIEDEKVRAQALLDIVNEINYFTQEKQ